MARFYGEVGYAITKETSPGIWTEVFDRRNYYGDVTKNYRRLENSNNLNDNIRFDNIISIVADPYAYENYSTIRYVEWMGAKWKVTSVEVQSPRLILNLGGVYNGDEIGTSGCSC